MRRHFLFPFALLLCAGPLHAQDRTARVDSIFSFATAATPGCAVGVSQKGAVLVNKSYGLADVEKRIPLSAASRFDIGSTQKQFTATSILLLVRGRRAGHVHDADDDRAVPARSVRQGRRLRVLESGGAGDPVHAGPVI